MTAFVERWRASGGAECANCFMFLTELCTSTGWIDLDKKSCFVLEAKQGTDAKLPEELPLFGLAGSSKTASSTAKRGTDAYRLTMQRARRQAENYAKALPTAHGWPPVLIVVDVGHSIECFAALSLTGKNYSQFSDARGGFKIMLDILYRAIEQANYKLGGEAAIGVRETQKPKLFAPIRNMPAFLEPDVEVSRYRAIAAQGDGYSGRNRICRAAARLPE